jgi:hypothetical protein
VQQRVLKHFTTTWVKSITAPQTEAQREAPAHTRCSWTPRTLQGPHSLSACRARCRRSAGSPALPAAPAALRNRHGCPSLHAVPRSTAATAGGGPRPRRGPQPGAAFAKLQGARACSACTVSSTVRSWAHSVRPHLRSLGPCTCSAAQAALGMTLHALEPRLGSAVRLPTKRTKRHPRTALQSPAGVRLRACAVRARFCRPAHQHWQGELRATFLA